MNNHFNREKIAFNTFDKSYLKLSAIWLSDAEIKRLTNAPEIDEERQLRWFKTLHLRNDYSVWGVSVECCPVGVVGLKNIDYTNLKCF